MVDLRRYYLVLNLSNCISAQKSNSEETDGIKQAISILQNAQPNAPQPIEFNVLNTAASTDFTSNINGANNIQHIAPTPIIDERNRRTTTESAPVYRGTRNYNSTKNIKRSNNTETGQGKLITLNAEINFAENNSTENDSREKKHRRRMTLKTNNSSTKGTTTSTAKPVAISPLIEAMKQEIQPIEINNLQRQEKLTDQIENLNPNAANLAPVRRFYRSSAEKVEEKEMAVVNNEKVQIVRPTAQSRLVGHYPTPSAAIAKLDEAVLGKVRTKKHTVTIVTPIENPKT